MFAGDGETPVAFFYFSEDGSPASAPPGRVISLARNKLTLLVASTDQGDFHGATFGITDGNTEYRCFIRSDFNGGYKIFIVTKGERPYDDFFIRRAYDLDAIFIPALGLTKFDANFADGYSEYIYPFVAPGSSGDRLPGYTVPPGEVRTGTTDALYPIPSQFTGKMREVAQCYWAMGKDIPFLADVPKTHGIIEYPYPHVVGGSKAEEEANEAARVYWLAEYVNNDGLYVYPIPGGKQCSSAWWTDGSHPAVLQSGGVFNLKAAYDAEPVLHNGVQKLCSFATSFPNTGVKPRYAWAISYTGREAQVLAVNRVGSTSYSYTLQYRLKVVVDIVEGPPGVYSLTATPTVLANGTAATGGLIYVGVAPALSYRTCTGGGVVHIYYAGENLVEVSLLVHPAEPTVNNENVVNNFGAILDTDTEEAADCCDTYTASTVQNYTPGSYPTVTRTQVTTPAVVVPRFSGIGGLPEWDKWQVTFSASASGFDVATDVEVTGGVSTDLLPTYDCGRPPWLEEGVPQFYPVEITSTGARPRVTQYSLSTAGTTDEALSNANVVLFSHDRESFAYVIRSTYSSFVSSQDPTLGFLYPLPTIYGAWNSTNVTVADGEITIANPDNPLEEYTGSWPCSGRTETSSIAWNKFGVWTARVSAIPSVTTTNIRDRVYIVGADEIIFSDDATITYTSDAVPPSSVINQNSYFLNANYVTGLGFMRGARYWSDPTLNPPNRKKNAVYIAHPGFVENTDYWRWVAPSPTCNARQPYKFTKNTVGFNLAMVDPCVDDKKPLEWIGFVGRL